MNPSRPGLPRFDDTVTTANVHERAEQVAVPNFDWMSTPVVAVVDAFLHIDPDAPPPPRRRYRPVLRPAAPASVDEAAQSATHLMADITRIHR
ncbi:hypothetical protein QLQ12_38365 [Actinoplanes sp. NEAU-A12]|uniref:Uncharacterized protein n=1 Tax=Actinoplanes sandaracinus TaxID=3045177 RepID=A0ABT6WXJ3_9ACTN|nr:hypothetical protein [Actinoplanes sandaracinus]MDI6104470.1 hypothetical protein [Actinoplanes sandaracinus]